MHVSNFSAHYISSCSSMKGSAWLRNTSAQLCSRHRALTGGTSISRWNRLPWGLVFGTCPLPGHGTASRSFGHIEFRRLRQQPRQKKPHSCQDHCGYNHEDDIVADTQDVAALSGLPAPVLTLGVFPPAPLTHQVIIGVRRPGWRRKHYKLLLGMCRGKGDCEFGHQWFVR